MFDLKAALIIIYIDSNDKMTACEVKRVTSVQLRPLLCLLFLASHQCQIQAAGLVKMLTAKKLAIPFSLW